LGREAMEGKNCNDNNLDAEFAKGAEFRRGRTGNGKGLNAEGAEGFPVEKQCSIGG